ncbi:hypothetical protein Tcan_15483, partial [Toxocara canis]
QEAARKSRQRKEEYVRQLEGQNREKDARLAILKSEIEQVKASNSRLLSYIEEMLRTFSDRSVEQSKPTNSQHPVSN